MSLRRAFIFGLLATCSLVVACSKSDPSGAKVESAKLAGSGASFPDPLYQRWFADYCKAHPGAAIDYQAVGSGGGINALIEKTVDFAASDAAMTEDEVKKVDGGVVMLPMTAGSIVLAYNVPGAPEGLKLSREAYVGIFLGKITKWNDPAIAKSNAGVSLPDLTITPVYRADSSGTTFVFTQHLSAVSADWKNGPGTGKSVNWKVGVGGKKNDGVAAQVKSTPGAIGYVEYGFLKSSGLMGAALENKDGAFVVANTKSAQVALASAPMPDNLLAWVPDPSGKESYPIVTYTWLLAYKTYKDAAKAKTLKDVIRYGLGDGQKVSEELGYIPLPTDVTTKILAKVDDIKP
ncbi:MAG: phosphate ABC transporter substrate-binding protein PstS [Pirellula sp.]|nr:phosphate ABC transporter substrate-binding protein PstS [Pirellula sp.]